MTALTDGDEGQLRRDRMLVCLSGAAHADLASWFGGVPRFSKELEIEVAP